MTPNLRGALWMVGAMGGFALEDMALKRAAVSLPVGQILLVFGTGGMLVFAALAARQGERVLHPAILSPVLLTRCVFEASGRLFYTLALALTPLSSTTAILQATPLVVVGGAALFLGERVGLRRWSAILVGFAGVLVVLRPGLEGFSALSLLAVAGMIGFAGRDLATRAAPKVLSNLQLGIYGFAMMIPAGVVMLALTGGAALPGPAAALWLGFATLIGVAAYFALTVAMRTGEVSAVTPFRYTRLLFALVLAMTIFGERPDWPVLAGSALIVASGIYTLMRQRRVGPRKAG